MAKTEHEKIMDVAVKNFMMATGYNELKARQSIEAMIYTKEPVILKDTETEFIVKDR